MYKENFLVDDSGKRIAVVVPIKKYDKMIEALEELEDIRAYDAVKASNETSVPIDVAFKIIETKRKAKSK
jgi:hypothetical protein